MAVKRQGHSTATAIRHQANSLLELDVAHERAERRATVSSSQAEELRHRGRVEVLLDEHCCARRPTERASQNQLETSLHPRSILDWRRLNR